MTVKKNYRIVFLLVDVKSFIMRFSSRNWTAKIVTFTLLFKQSTYT